MWKFVNQFFFSFLMQHRPALPSPTTPPQQPLCLLTQHLCHPIHNHLTVTHSHLSFSPPYCHRPVSAPSTPTPSPPPSPLNSFTQLRPKITTHHNTAQAPSPFSNPATTQATEPPNIMEIGYALAFMETFTFNGFLRFCNQEAEISESIWGWICWFILAVPLPLVVSGVGIWVRDETIIIATRKTPIAIIYFQIFF